MMHYRATKLLSAYLDGQLSPGETVILEQHLGNCTKCRSAMDEIQEGSRMVRVAFGIIAKPQAFSSPRKDIAKESFALRRNWIFASLLVGFLILLGLAVYKKQYRGELPLELLVDEILTEPAEVEEDDGRYSFVTKSTKELAQLTGESYPELSLPSEFNFRKGFRFRERYGSATGRMYWAEDGRFVCILEQPAGCSIDYGSTQPVDGSFCGKECQEIVTPSFRFLSWEDDSKRTLLLSNLDKRELEDALAGYPGIKP